MAGQSLDQVLQSVTDENTLIDSVLTLLQGVEQQLKDIIGGALPAAVQAKVDAVFDGLEAQKTKLQAAITANTPVPPQA